MAPLASTDILFFEDFRLDRRGGGLSRRDDSGAFVPVQIGSRGLDILDVLIARPGDVVSKDEIIAAVWPRTVVEDSNLTVQISALRQALDQGRAQGSLIQTVPGRGYRFVAPVTRRASELLSSAVTFFPGGGSPRPRLSIVVLPFTNLSDDREQQYFVDGITEDLTTDLSRLVNMMVISRNTAFTYRNKSVVTKEIGRELNVRYILEGGVQRSGNHVRINAQLIDAETDVHLWAERFDRDIGDRFVLQSEITSRIAVALNLELTNREAARRTDNPDAQDYILRARAVYLKPLARANHAEAVNLLQRAVAIEPGSVEAQSRLADALAGRVLANMTDSASADLERAKKLIEQALGAAPLSVVAHNAKGQLLRAQGRYADAIPEYETVLSLDRNFVYAYFGLGQCLLFTGSIEETIPLIERAIRLSPRDPVLGVCYENIGLVHLLQSRTGEAILWLEKARDHTPAHSIIRAQLASAYSINGETERAAAELAEARRLSPDDRYLSIARQIAVREYQGLPPKILALLEATYFTGLRKAGMPET